MYPIVSRTSDHPLILKGSPSKVATRLTVFKHVEKHKASNGHVSHARGWFIFKWNNNGHSHDLLTKGLILLMEEIPNNHLAYIKPWKYWDIDHINWCRILPSTVLFMLQESCNILWRFIILPSQGNNILNHCSYNVSFPPNLDNYLQPVPIPSMYGVYLPTWIVDFYGKFTWILWKFIFVFERY